MKKEIGGYLELEEPAGQEYYPDLCGVNLGRTALLWLMEARRCKKIYLPFFLCDSVTGACERSGAEIEFYHMDEGLHPVLEERTLPEGEYLYLVNYYGQLTDDKIRKYKKIYGNIIVDHTHAFFQKPLPGVDTLYSCRKFLGVSDGAYLSTDAELEPEKKPLDIPWEEWSIFWDVMNMMPEPSIRKCWIMQQIIMRWRSAECPV